MNCPTWNELASYGERILREGSAERVRAERHIAWCPSCAERAFLLDASWAVGRSTRSRAPSFDESEVAALKRNVLDAGRLRDLASSLRSRRRGLRVVAAAAALAVIVAGAVLLRTARPFEASDGSRAAASAVKAILPVRLAEPLPVLGSGPEALLPTVGSLAPAAARVYNFGENEFSLVMVVHETLDI